jgi:hypothetical protein
MRQVSWSPIAQAKSDAVDGVLCAFAGGNRAELAWRTRFKELVFAAAERGHQQVDIFGLQDRAKKDVRNAERRGRVSSK